MSVVIFDQTNILNETVDVGLLEKTIEAVMKFLELPKGDIEVTLTDDLEIKRLNDHYRNQNKPTDIISFPHYTWHPPEECVDVVHLAANNALPFWGEMIISLETVGRNSNERKLPLEQELIRVCIHGMLHLFGYDHKEDSQYELMNSVESKAMEIIRGRKNKQTP